MPRPNAATDCTCWTRYRKAGDRPPSVIRGPYKCGRRYHVCTVCWKYQGVVAERKGRPAGYA